MPARKIRKDDDAKFSLRIPRDIREWLEKKAENQSINAFILAVLKKEKAQDERVDTVNKSA